MSLPTEDALLLVLLLGSMSLLIAGDVFHLGRWTRHLGAVLAGPQGLLLRAGWSRQPPPPPRAARPNLAGRATPAAALPQAADLLLVDDSAVARAKLRRLFESNGYKVHLACDGVEALALLAVGRYAMMITDLEMPNMNGIALVAECVKQPQAAGMPIIAVSAHENLRAIFNECRHVCGVHRKPWVDDVLLSHVATLVGTRSRSELTPA